MICTNIIFLLIICVINVISQSQHLKYEVANKECEFVKGLHANLIRFVSKEGYHREIEDTIEVTVTNSRIPLNHFTSPTKPICSFALLAKFDQNLYIDPYEIKRDKEFEETIKILNKWTDLENPAWAAKSNSTIFIQFKPQLTGNLISTASPIKTPVHFRYQRPMSHKRFKNDHYSGGLMNPSGYVQINIPLPKLLLYCENWDKDMVRKNCQAVETVCSVQSNERCFWISIPFKSNNKGSQVYIPIGDSDSKILITFLTILIIFVGVFFILYNLIGAKNKQDQNDMKLHLD